MRAYQDVLPTAPLARIALAMRLAARSFRRWLPRRRGPVVRVVAQVPSSRLNVLLTMRGPDGAAFRCVEIGSPAMPAPPCGPDPAGRQGLPAAVRRRA